MGNWCGSISANCGGYELLWWIIMRDAVPFSAYCGGYLLQWWFGILEVAAFFAYSILVIDQALVSIHPISA